MKSKSLFLLILGPFVLVFYQNCTQGFLAQKSTGSSSSNPQPNNQPNEVDQPSTISEDYEGALPPVGKLILGNEFESMTSIQRDFEFMGLKPGWEGTRDRGVGQPRRDPVYEESHFTRPEQAFSSETMDSTNYLKITSEPNILDESGLTPETCNANLMRFRQWTNFDTGERVQNELGDDGRWLSNNGRGKIQVYDGQPAEYLDVLDACRIYTGRAISKQKFGPGTRIQVRVNMSDVSRTGHVHKFRLTNSQAYDNNSETGVDMSVFEFGWDDLWLGQDTSPTRSWLNTAVRWGGSSFAYFLDTTTNDLPAFYQFQSTWNSYFSDWFGDAARREVTQVAAEVPADHDVLEGWYIYTVDWQHDKLEFYLQKDNDDAEPVKYFSTTNPEMISHSCEQEIWLGNNVSQTFSENHESTVWAYVNENTDFQGLQMIESEQFPGGKNFKKYSSESMAIDWIRIYEIPGGSGEVVCQ